MERFFEDPESITVEELKAVVRKAVIAMDFCPVMCGSSFKNKGVQNLLDAVIAYLPHPLDIPAAAGKRPRTEEAVTFEIDPEARFLHWHSRSRLTRSWDVCATLAFIPERSSLVHTCTTRVPRKKNVFLVCSKCTQINNSRKT